MGAKCIFSTKTIFSASFNVIVSWESVFLLVLIQSILNTKQKQKKRKKFFLVLKIRFENISLFFCHFSGDGDNIGDRQFLGDLLSYSKRVILLLPRLQVSYGVLGNFFSTNWP